MSSHLAKHSGACYWGPLYQEFRLAADLINLMQFDKIGHSDILDDKLGIMQSQNFKA